MTDPIGSRRSSPNRLYRDPDNGPVLGVCAGVAEYFGVTPMAVRVVAVFGLVFFTLPMVIAYGAAGMFLDTKPDGLFANDEEEDFGAPCASIPARRWPIWATGSATWSAACEPPRPTLRRVSSSSTGITATCEHCRVLPRTVRATMTAY